MTVAVPGLRALKWAVIVPGRSVDAEGCDPLRDSRPPAVAVKPAELEYDSSWLGVGRPGH